MFFRKPVIFLNFFYFLDYIITVYKYLLGTYKNFFFKKLNLLLKFMINNNNQIIFKFFFFKKIFRNGSFVKSLKKKKSFKKKNFFFKIFFFKLFFFFKYKLNFWQITLQKTSLHLKTIFFNFFFKKINYFFKKTIFQNLKKKKSLKKFLKKRILRVKVWN